MTRHHKRVRKKRSLSVHLQLPNLLHQSQPRKVLKAVDNVTFFFSQFIFISGLIESFSLSLSQLLQQCLLQCLPQNVLHR